MSDANGTQTEVRALDLASSLASVAGLLCLVLLSNGLLLIAVRNSHSSSVPKGRRWRLPNVDFMLVVVSLVSIANGLLGTVFQATSFVYGKWIAGEPLCQFQGFVTNLLNFCIVWYISLISFERYTHRLQPQEYNLTLSKLNLRVILIGIFFLLLTAVSWPIYGWGQYNYIPDLGLCSLHMASHNIVTYLSLSLAVYVFLPYIASGIWYSLLITKSEPLQYTISKDDEHSLFEGRSNIYAFAASSLTSLLLGAPWYTTNVLQCNDYSVDATLVLVFWWLHSFSLNCCYQLCCICLCGRLRDHIYRIVLCSLKSRCRHLQLPVAPESDVPPMLMDVGR